MDTTCTAACHCFACSSATICVIAQLGGSDQHKCLLVLNDAPDRILKGNRATRLQGGSNTLIHDSQIRFTKGQVRIGKFPCP